MKPLFFIFSFCLTFLTSAQHYVKGQFTPPEDYKMAIIYRVTPKEAIYVAHDYIDEKGVFVIDLDSTVTSGMMRLVYGVPQEENNFDFIYNGNENIEFNFNDETGVEFTKSTENQLMNAYTNSMGMVSQSIGMFYREQRQDSLTLETIFNTQRDTQNNFEKAAQGTIALNFIMANKPYIPNAYEDIQTYISNLKTHYFDHVDFENLILQSSNFLTERVLNYVFGMANDQTIEYLIYQKNFDELTLTLKDVDPELKIRLYEIVWQQMVDASYDSVAKHIAENYLIQLAKSSNNEELIKKLEGFNRIAMGSKAPNFKLGSAVDALTLHELNSAKLYVLVFWSSTCGHCLKEMPQLHKLIKESKLDITVVAVGLEDDEILWKSETYNYPLFTHVLGLGKWDNAIGKLYNINATPEYFVLDKDKTIIAKPYDFEVFKAYLENEFNGQK